MIFFLLRENSFFSTLAYVLNEYSLLLISYLSLIIIPIHFFRNKNHHSIEWFSIVAHTYTSFQINDLVAWFLMISQKKILLTNTNYSFFLPLFIFLYFLHTKKNIFYLLQKFKEKNANVRSSSQHSIN